MKSEEIRMKIKSVRYEVMESLFSRLCAESDDEIAEIFTDGDELEEEAIEISTAGRINYRDGRVELVYDETELTGMEGSRTSVSFDESAPGLISMLREGSVSTALVFEAGKRHHCVYNTPYMPFEICVHTLTVENTLDTDGIIRIDYIIEIRGAKAERTKFELRVL